MNKSQAPVIDFSDLQFIDDLNQPPKIIKGITNVPKPEDLHVNFEIVVGNYPGDGDASHQCGDSIYRITDCQPVENSKQYAIIASHVVH